MSMFILQLGSIKWPINQNAFVMVRKAFNDGFLTVSVSEAGVVQTAPLSQNCDLTPEWIRKAFPFSAGPAVNKASSCRFQIRRL